MTAAIPLILERDNVNDESVVLVRWFAKHGEWVEAGVLLAEIETSKANIEVYSPQAGFLIQSFPEGADVPVSAPIGHLSQSVPELAPRTLATPPDRPAAELAAAPSPRPLAQGGPPAPTGASPYDTSPDFPISAPYHQRFSPVAAKMMEAHGLSLSDFSGKSIVRKQDVLDFLHPPAISFAPANPFRAPAKIAQPYKEIALSRMKRREGQSLAAGVGNAIQSAVSVTCFTRGLRGNLSAGTAAANLSAVIVYEVSRLLRKYPAFNATYRDGSNGSDGSMLQYEQVNVGYAMDDGRGLKVAVFPACDTLSLQQVSTLLNDLTVAYIEDKLTPAHIANATFTVSDLSGMGVSSFYPLISENQGAILGVGAEQFPPDGAYGFYQLTLAFDHQLSDGRTAALFLNDLKSRLQGYESALQNARQEIACSKCGRTAEQLAEFDLLILVSALPKGYLCTACAAGY